EPTTGENSGEVFSRGRHVAVLKKIFVNGSWYYKTAWDVEHNNDWAIPASDFEEIPFVTMETPRAFKLKTDLRKQLPKTGEHVDEVLRKGRELNFTTKIVIDGKMYLRTEYDTLHGNEKGVPFKSLAEL